MDIQNLYQELIIDHGTNPRNFSTLENANYSAEGYNPICGDKIQLFLKIENDRITEVCFQGSGCAISTASASLMTEILTGKTKEEASLLFESLQGLMTHQKLSCDKLTELGKMVALSGVQAFPMRVKCATLPWHTMLSALKAEKSVATTESIAL